MEMSKIVMPDFEEWSIRLAGAMFSYRPFIVEGLKHAFDQGYALGYRDAVEVAEEREELTNTQEMWYDAIDGDVMEQTRLSDLDEQPPEE